MQCNVGEVSVSNIFSITDTIYIYNYLSDFIKNIWGRKGNDLKTLYVIIIIYNCLFWNTLLINFLHTYDFYSGHCFFCYSLITLYANNSINYIYASRFIYLLLVYNNLYYHTEYNNLYVYKKINHIL